MIKLNVGHNIKTLGNSEIHDGKHLKIPVDVVLRNVGGGFKDDLKRMLYTQLEPS